MLGTSIGEWVFIRLSIALFRYIPVLYIFSLATCLLFANVTAWGYIGAFVSAILLLVEGTFFVLVWRPYQIRLGEAAIHPPPLSRQERKELFHQCFDNVDLPEAYVKGWFLGAELEDICRGDLREFLLWAFFDRDDTHSTTHDESDEEDLEEFIQRIESLVDYRFKPGRGPCNSLRLTLEGIETTYRSFLWYIIVFAVDQLTHVLLMYKGFQYYAAPTQSVFPPRPQQYLSRHRSPEDNLAYWYRPHKSTAKRPLVFFHGIGIGLLVYIEFLAALLKTPSGADDGIGIIVVELLPISFRLTRPPPSRAEFLEQITRLIDSHKWEDFVLASHSYGSVLVTHMLGFPALEKRVHAVVLIDPVTVMLHLPDVAYNFTRRRPHEANQWQLWYFASTDPGVAHCLGRHFFWRQNIVWREDLLGLASNEQRGAGRKVVVSLSGRDLITKPGTIAQYLEAGNGQSGEIDVITFPHLDHAQVFDSPAQRQQLVALARGCL